MAARHFLQGLSITDNASNALRDWQPAFVGPMVQGPSGLHDAGHATGTSIATGMLQLTTSREVVSHHVISDESIADDSPVDDMMSFWWPVLRSSP